MPAKLTLSGAKFWERATTVKRTAVKLTNHTTTKIFITYNSLALTDIVTLALRLTIRKP